MYKLGSEVRVLFVGQTAEQMHPQSHNREFAQWVSVHSGLAAGVAIVA